MKKSYFLMLMALVFLLQGCRTETINEENNQYSHEVTKALYDMQKVPQFSSFISRAKSKKENSKNSLNALNGKSKVLVITKPDITSYSTLVRNADSGFEILVYSVDKNGKESFYKAKYIPENKTVNNKIENFTGKVEFSNDADELLQTVRYNNGVVVNTNEKTNVSSKSSPCHYYVTITAVRCTAGDGHAPGEACSGTADQQPYYDVYVSQYCNQEQDAGGFTTGSGSYGGTGEYGSYGGGFNALELIMNNTDTYHWNLFNQLSADNRTKIVELITYNTIDGSMYNFMISFFNQNPTTTVQQFLNWFMYDIHITTDMDVRVKCILQKMAGDTNISDDKITLPITPASDNLFQKMLRMFNGNNTPPLTFRYDPTLSATTGAYATTRSNNGTSYEIVIGSDLLQMSNIRIMTTLVHELTHAFMLNELNQLNMIEWMPNGQPKIPNNVADVCTTNHEFSQDNAHFFAELLCYYIDHPSPQLTPQNQWLHDLFGILDNNFKPEAYVQKLAEYVQNNYDWNSESANWTSAMQTKYGTDWKAKVAMNLQMDAIRQTYYFTTVSTQTHDQFHNEIVSIIDNGHLPNSNNSYPANKNCN